MNIGNSYESFARERESERKKPEEKRKTMTIAY
jgi:hypothetical protein